MSIRKTVLFFVLGTYSAQLSIAQPPGMGGEERMILDQFDSDQSGWLNNAEREAARKFLRENPLPRRGFGGPPGGPGGFGPGGPGPGGFGPGGPGPGGFGPGGPGPDGFGPGGPGPRGEDRPADAGGRDFGPPPGEGREGRGGFGGRGGRGRGPGSPGFPGGAPGGFGGNRPAATQGVQVDKASVEPVSGELYDLDVLRTVFIDFENADWEKELEEFHGTDVDVPATLTVDGITYEGVGIHFRGMSSYGMVPAGYKRSLNLSLDLIDESQRLLGYKTLNLLNGSGDESMMSTVLYSQIARQYTPAPKANFVRVVINGENWGVYANVQQFNKDFLNENYGSDEGARWKVSGSPRGGGGLDYRGPDPASYQNPYEQKSGGKKALSKLIELCRVMEETPTDELPAALEPICDIDGLLWFLALDNGLINSDGYWVRASDYSIYLDKDDKFHFIPHDMNEAFRGAGGPGMRRDSASGSPFELDPLVGLDEVSKPLRSKVLAVPKYREQYLLNIRELAEKSLAPDAFDAMVAKASSVIDDAVKAETRKLGSYDAFVAATRGDQSSRGETQRRGGHGAVNLKEFAKSRREYLLNKENK